jgi:hypothetical protein
MAAATRAVALRSAPALCEAPLRVVLLAMLSVAGMLKPSRSGCEAGTAEERTTAKVPSAPVGLGGKTKITKKAAAAETNSNICPCVDRIVEI